MHPMMVNCNNIQNSRARQYIQLERKQTHKAKKEIHSLVMRSLGLSVLCVPNIISVINSKRII